MLEIIEDQCDIGGILAQVLRQEVGWLRSPGLGVTPEIPFAEEPGLSVFVPQVRQLRV